MYKVTSIGSHAAPSCHLLLHVFVKFMPNACKHSETQYCTLYPQFPYQILIFIYICICIYIYIYIFLNKKYLHKILDQKYVSNNASFLLLYTIILLIPLSLSYFFITISLISSRHFILL